MALDDIGAESTAASGSKAAQLSAPASPLPVAAQCPGDASFEAPLQYGWKAGAAPLVSYVPYAAVLGPFSEPRQAKTSSGNLKTLPNGQPDTSGGHVGIDFAADEGTPVLAVANGFVQQVKNENWTCATKKTALKKTGDKADPGYSLTLAVTNTAGTVIDRAIYRHLLIGGLQVAGLRDLADSQKCWKDDAKNRSKAKYPVTVKTILAKSGASGTCNTPGCVKQPHVHFEWYPAFVSSTTVPSHARNPLCKLATIYPGRIDSTYASPNNAEMSYRLYAKPAAGTVDYNGNAKTLTEFLVRRNKLATAQASNPCLVTGLQGPCDVGIRGWFGMPMLYPAPGSAWPRDSQGDMGRAVLSTTTRGILEIAWPFVFTPSGEELTPPPTTQVVQPTYVVDQSVPCAPAGQYTFTVEVFWDRSRHLTRTFALSERADVSFPLEPGGASCGYVINRQTPGL